MSDHLKAEADYVMRTYGHMMPYYGGDRPAPAKPVGRSGPKVDLTGHRFGMLTALAPIPPEKGRGWRWHCRCDCGGESTPYAFSLINRNTLSCGCQRNHQPKRREWPADETKPTETPR